MIRLLTSATTDLDADAHVGWLTRHAGARVEGVVTAEWPLIARAGLRLMRRRGGRDDVLVTVGSAALAAARIGWRGGRIIHVPVGAVSPRERAILARSRSVDVVTSTRAVAQSLAHLGRQRVTWIVPPTPPTSRSRDEARRALGLSPDGLVVALPGTIRRGSGHRLAVWGCAILAFRDSTWRIRVAPRGQIDDLAAYIEANIARGSQASIRIVDEDEADAILPAADVAVFADDGVPERVAIDAAMAAGCAIVAPRAVWRRERLPAIDKRCLFDVLRPRDIAKSILLVTDDLDACRATPDEPVDTGTAWRRGLGL